MENKIKILLIALVTISTMIIYTKVFTQGIEEDFFPECPKYVGDLNKRGNVKNAAEAFELLLNQEDEIKDTIVSTSFLKEKGKPDDYYAPWKANDNNKNTAWVEGVKGDGIGEKIYINIIGRGIDDFKPLTINFNIINGYAATEELFKANNRIKKAKLTIYEAKFDLCGGYYSKRYSDLIVNNYKIIDFPDTTNPQTIQMKIPTMESIKKKDIVAIATLFIAELEILEVYKGTKFSDTCISEFNVKDIIDGK